MSLYTRQISIKANLFVTQFCTERERSFNEHLRGVYKCVDAFPQKGGAREPSTRVIRVKAPITQTSYFLAICKTFGCTLASRSTVCWNVLRDVCGGNRVLRVSCQSSHSMRPSSCRGRVFSKDVSTWSDP